MDADLRPQEADKSLGELFHRASEQASTLVRDEVALAKIELRHDIKEAVAGITLFSVAGLTSLLAVLMLSVAAGLGIGRAIGDGWAWLGFVIVGVLYLVVAGIAAVLGKGRVEDVPPPAPRATRQAKETVAAAKEINR